MFRILYLNLFYWMEIIFELVGCFGELIEQINKLIVLFLEGVLKVGVNYD